VCEIGVERHPLWCTDREWISNPIPEDDDHVSNQIKKTQARSGWTGGEAARPADDTGGGLVCVLVCGSAQTKKNQYDCVPISSDSRIQEVARQEWNIDQRWIKKSHQEEPFSEESKQSVKRRGEHLGWGAQWLPSDRGVACGMSSFNVTSGALKLATWRQKWLDDTSHNNGKKQAYLVCLVQDGLGDFVWWRPAAWQEVEKATGTIIPCSINTMSKPRRLVACGSDQVTCMMAAINHGIGQMGRWASMSQLSFVDRPNQIDSQIIAVIFFWGIASHLEITSFLCISFETNPETNNKGASPDAIANPFLSKTISNKEFSQVAAGRGTLWHHASHAYRLFYNNHVTALLSHRHLHGRLDPIIDLDVVAQAMC
jgi:hypothetical protein